MTKEEKIRKLVEESKKAGLTADEILEGLQKVAASAHGETKKPLSSRDVVTHFLEDMGVPKHIKGYYYLREAVLQYHPGVQITKELYPMVAKTFETTGSRVERAIRHAVETALDRCPPDVIYREFGNTLDPRKDKPSNSEVIATLAEKLENAMRPE